MAPAGSRSIALALGRRAGGRGATEGKLGGRSPSAPARGRRQGERSRAKRHRLGPRSHPARSPEKLEGLMLGGHTRQVQLQRPAGKGLPDTAIPSSGKTDCPRGGVAGWRGREPAGAPRTKMRLENASRPRSGCRADLFLQSPWLPIHLTRPPPARFQAQLTPGVPAPCCAWRMEDRAATVPASPAEGSLEVTAAGPREQGASGSAAARGDWATCAGTPALPYPQLHLRNGTITSCVAVRGERVPGYLAPRDVEGPGWQLSSV